MPPQQTGRPALRNGLIFGAILAAVGLGNSLIQWLAGAYVVSTHAVNGFTSVNVNDTGPTAFLGCVVFLAVLALTFVAGMLAARRTGKVGTGSIAGLIAGAFSALVGGTLSLVVNIVLVAPALQVPAASTMTPSQVQALFIGTTVAGLILRLFFDSGVGAGMGALGGLLGANTYRKSLPVGPAPYAPVYPGMPGMPGAGPAPQPWPYANPQYPSQYPPQYPSQYPPQNQPPSGFPPPPPPQQ